MEAHRHFGKLGIGSRFKGSPTRKNSVLIAALSAVLAAALIFLFVTHYKKNTVAPPLAPTQVAVWVARQPIPLGTPETAIAAAGYFKQTQVPSAQAVAGAIVDPSQVVGEVTSTAVAAGQQITSSDFTKSVQVLSADLRGDQRAVAFSFDTEHGISTWLSAGDTVDVMLVNTLTHRTELIDQNVSVLENKLGLVVLKLTDKQALLVTAASTQGSLWLSLRPALNANNSIKIYSVGG